MRNSSHIAGATCAAMMLVPFTKGTVTFEGISSLIVVGVIGGLLPNVDRLFFRAKKTFLKKLHYGSCGGRRIFHDAILWGFIFALMGYMENKPWFNSMLAMTFANGVFSHLLLDSLNPTGIPFLGERFSTARIKEGSYAEVLLRIVLYAIAFASITLILWKRGIV